MTSSSALCVAGASIPSVRATVWVCVAVFNRLSYTRTCLDLLRQQSYPSLQTVVVDDGSTDGTSAVLRAEYPEVTVLTGNGSLFWTGAMHRGLAHILEKASSSDYVLLLNNDLTFSADLISDLVRFSSAHPQAWLQAVEAAATDPDRIWQGGVRINWWTAKHARLNHLRRRSEFPAGHCEPSDYLTGRGVLIPISVLRETGNFDLRHVQYGDGELSRRAAKKGYPLLVAYGVPVFSYEKGNNLNEAESYSLRDLRRYYFGRLSSSNLSLRWKQAASMTGSRLQSLTFFACDLVRITVHFAKRLRWHSPQWS